MTENAQGVENAGNASEVLSGSERGTIPSRGFILGKRLLDIAAALIALPLVAIVALVLIIINPLFNAGPLVFAQTRMGRGCVPFRAYKFRTMRQIDNVERGPHDPLETHRITRLGHLMRRMRVDELPQFLNVLLGEMSLIGPRPDYWDHALHYAATIPGYRQRHTMRPGITGLAQVATGYAESADQTVVKTRHDLRYIANAGWRMDADVLWRTARVVLTGFGAR